MTDDAFGARRNPAWGAPPSASFPTTSSLGFTGHEDDAELGLVNMKGRLYDPHLGRFLTPDPIVAHPGFGQSWNPYSYVLNGPLSHVDPTGFTEEPADAVVSPGGFLIVQQPNAPGDDITLQPIAVGAAAVVGVAQGAGALAKSSFPGRESTAGAQCLGSCCPEDANHCGVGYVR